MHELSITQRIVAIAAERAGARRVRRLQLRIGMLAGVDVQAVRFCFDVCAKGSVLEGARLEIEEVPGRGRCQGCEREVAVARLVGICPCEQRAPMALVAGQELVVTEMEVESCAEPAVAPTEPE